MLPGEACCKISSTSTRALTAGDVMRPQRHAVAQAGAHRQSHAVDAAVGRPARRRRLAGQFRQEFVGAFQGVAVKRLVMPGQIVVRPGVITLFVTRVRGLRDQVRSGLRPLADSEERRLHATPPQDLQHLRRPLPCRAVIDRERDEPGRRGGTKRRRRHVRRGPRRARSPRGRSLLRPDLHSREPGTGPGRAAGGEQTDPGQEPAAIHVASLTCLTTCVDGWSIRCRLPNDRGTYPGSSTAPPVTLVASSRVRPRRQAIAMACCGTNVPDAWQMRTPALKLRLNRVGLGEALG